MKWIFQDCLGSNRGHLFEVLESRSFPRDRQETLSGPQIFELHSYFKMVSCVYYFFWQNPGSSTAQNLQSGLGHDSMVSEQPRFFSRKPSSPTAASNHCGQDESNRSRDITSQLCCIDLPWLSDSRRICGQCFLLLISTADNQTQTSGTRCRVESREGEKQKVQEGCGWLRASLEPFQPDEHHRTRLAKFQPKVFSVRSWK